MALRGGKWATVAAMCAPVFILTVDANGITVALPDLGKDLGASTTDLQWVLNAYLLTFASSLIAVGRLGDIVGRRLVLIVGTSIFGAASLLSASAPRRRS
jgi:MFS family permease